MPRRRRPTTEEWLHMLLAALTGILVLLTIMLWREYRSIPPLSAGKRTEWVGARHGGSLSVPTDVLRPWMTFEYVNRIFALPPEYLRKVLGIDDTRYPRMSVASYAKHTGLSPEAVIDRIADAIAFMHGTEQ
ncbi:hypothetical protein FJY94_00390 [Candidatus Kaiserbacteria bacterium]|nr:hypothetical protein [Candidatus Kaiserbacteria bacterium]